MTEKPVPLRAAFKPQPDSKAAEFVPIIDEIIMGLGLHHLTENAAEWESARDAYLAEEAKADAEAERFA